MSALEAKFASLRERSEKALVAFITAGDPDLESLPTIIAALEEAAVDVIEVGIPFSDPIADGPTIQASSQRALERGVTIAAILTALADVDCRVPIVLMGYMNPILRSGLERFASAAAAAGVSGTIVSDLTPEEAGPWIDASRAAGLDNVFLVAPTSTDRRLDAVCAASSGFVYAVSRTGVTGAKADVPADVGNLVSRVRRRTALPVCVGFGISSPEQVREVCKFADGAVVGSWLVSRIAESWDRGSGREKLVEAVAALKSATR
jgi:tryptophan synthase alpha chain